MIVYNPVNAKTLLALQSEGFINVSQPAQLREALAGCWGQEFRFIYTPIGGVERTHFEAVNKMVASVGQCVYAVDEVDKNQEPGWCPPNFSALCNYGRHYETALIGTARRPGQVSKDFTFCLSEICAFNISEPGQLKYFGDKCGQEAAMMLPSLGKYEYLRWMQDGRTTTGKGWE